MLLERVSASLGDKYMDVYPHKAALSHHTLTLRPKMVA